MKKNYLYQITKTSGGSLGQPKKYCLILGFIFTGFSSYAQFSNSGDVKVSDNTILSIHMDYENKDTGNFINDGLVHVFQNWNNNGIVSFTNSLKGKTFFTGAEEQIIEGSKTANFQNILFNSRKAAKVPFHLGTAISVAGTAEFIKGIINADDYDGLMIFKENAGHLDVSDLSFVDGKVQKQGQKAFEFPVGDELYFRPSFHDAGTSPDHVYTTQYFYKNSNTLYSHNSKEETILTINDKEYWNVTQDKGADKIILSLTLREGVTPAAFYNLQKDEKIVIVRWDENQKKWINDGGELSALISGETYSNLLTGKVGGYGIFTMAIAKKTLPDPEDVIVYNAISPNDDGLNDSFLIKGIDQFPDNEVEIYNRWGVKVFDTQSYNESDNMFRGYSDGRATVKRGDKLPTGTYFYILKYNNGKKVVEKTGYLYINNQ